jgi:hypothetical protein
LYRWHWHLVAAPRAPKTVCRSSQLASLAGTTEIAGSRFVTHALLRERAAANGAGTDRGTPGCAGWSAAR